MTIEERLSGKNSVEISNILTEVEKERLKYESDLDLIELEINQLDREILKLRSRKKELEETATKARQLIREKRLDYKIAERCFWNSKNA